MKKLLLIGLLALSVTACTTKPNAHTEFYVRGNCGMCQERIDKAALALAGVSEAEWSEESSMLKVGYDSTRTSPMEIEKTIAALGHATEHVPMDSAAHKALPECCQEHAKPMEK